MDDATINRLVAERVLGWRQKAGSKYQWVMPDDRPSGLPDFCNSPAAWGELLVWLARCGWTPRLVCETSAGNCWSAYLYDKTARVAGSSSESRTPGRALALAALRAYGVEVDE